MATRTQRNAPKNGVPNTISRNETPTTEEYQSNQYLGFILQGSGVVKNRLLIGVPSTGEVRMEWAMARYNQIIPTNWSAAECIQYMPQYTPLGYNVADARNLVVDLALTQNFGHVLFIDSDVIVPPDLLMKMNRYIREDKIPCVFGVYWTKSIPSEPLVYRYIGSSYYRNWKVGDRFWVSGVGLGCTLVNVKLFRAMAEDAPYYLAGGQYRCKRVFDTPQVSWFDDENKFHSYSGTEDLAWCKRVKDGDYMRKAGFPSVGRRTFQFYVDASIICKHITPDGVQYPLVMQW